MSGHLLQSRGGAKSLEGRDTWIRGRCRIPFFRAGSPPEFRSRMIDLVRSGRSPEDPAKKFEPSGQTIRNWVQQADRDDSLR